MLSSYYTPKLQSEFNDSESFSLKLDLKVVEEGQKLTKVLGFIDTILSFLIEVDKLFSDLKLLGFLIEGAIKPF